MSGLQLFFNTLKASGGIGSFQSKFAGWWEGESNNALIDQINSQNRSSFTQNSIAGQLFNGKCVNLGGGTKYLSSGSATSDTDIGTGDFFFSMNIIFDTFTGFLATVGGKRTTGTVNGEWWFSTGSSSFLLNIRDSSTTHSISLIPSVVTGTRYHIMFGVQSGVVRAYVDGVATGTTPTLSAIAATTSAFTQFGANNFTAYTGAFRLWGVRIFKGKFLSSTERTTNYNQRYVAGVTQWWTMSLSDGTKPVYSARTGGVTLTQYGTPNYTDISLAANIFNDFGYAEDATDGLIPPDMLTLDANGYPTQDCKGNALVFKGSAKQNINSSAGNFKMFDGAVSNFTDIIQNASQLISANTWWSGTTSQTIAQASVFSYLGMRQFYSASKKALILIKKGEYLTASQESILCDYLEISSKSHAYHANSTSLFARFTNPITDRDKSIYDNTIRLVAGQWSKYELLYNSAPFKEEMILNWVGASNNLAETGSRLTYVNYKGRAAQTNTWQSGLAPSSMTKFLQNDAFIAWKHSENQVIPSGSNNTQFLGNGTNINGWWDYDFNGSRVLRAGVNTLAPDVWASLPTTIKTNSTFVLNRTGASATNLVVETTVISNTSTSNARSATEPSFTGYYQNFNQHYALGGSLTQAESLLHCLVFDQFNEQFSTFAGEWIVESGYRYKLSNKVILDRLGDAIIWSDYKNLYYSIDNGVTVTASGAFDSGTLGWIHMAHIFDNGDIILATNKNKLYGTTTALTTITEIIPTKNGVPYVPHTPASSTYPGEYYKFIGPKYKQYLPDGTEIFVWNPYSVSLRGAAPSLVLYSLGRTAVKIAREFGQNPYIRDNGLPNGGTTGTLLGDASVTKYVRHGHGVVQKKNDKSKFLAMYGDLDRALLAPATSSFYEVKWEEGTYNKDLDSWSWTEIVETPSNQRFKSTPGYFTATELFWSSDADPGDLAEAGYFRAPIGDLANKASHTRFYYPNVPTYPGNMFYLNESDMFMMGGGYAAVPGAGYLFNDPNVIAGTIGGTINELPLKLPGNIYIPIIMKRADKKYTLLCMTNYDYYRNGQSIEIEFN